MRHLVAPTLLAVLGLAGCFREHGAGESIMRGDCATCHLDVYPASHPGEGKSTDCGSCHDTTDWGNASHPEARFPIAGGAHGGIACTECHLASLGPVNGAANTDCIHCHTGQHDKSRMDDAHLGHDGAAGYSWDEAMPHNCLSCHPDGRNRF
jgi:Cytochrome c3